MEKIFFYVINLYKYVLRLLNLCKDIKCTTTISSASYTAPVGYHKYFILMLQSCFRLAFCAIYSTNFIPIIPYAHIFRTPLVFFVNFAFFLLFVTEIFIFYFFREVDHILWFTYFVQCRCYFLCLQYSVHSSLALHLEGNKLFSLYSF